MAGFGDLNLKFPLTLALVLITFLKFRLSKVDHEMGARSERPLSIRLFQMSSELYESLRFGVQGRMWVGFS